MQIVFYPDTLVKNKYIELLLTALKNNTVDVVNNHCTLTDIMKFGLYWRIVKGVRIFHFNWLLTSISKKTIKTTIVSLLLFLWIILIKCLGGKIIWTVHNKLPHDCKNKTIVRFYRRFLFFIADRIIIHSRSTQQFIASIISNKKIMKKVVRVPHGNYIGCYRDTGTDARTRLNIPAKAFVFLHLGLIKPYKNIDMLMSAFSSLSLPDTRLLIAGCAVPPNYQTYLNTIADEDDTIIFIPEFIPDDSIAEIINTGDIVILPYAKESFINSGSLYLSLSFAKPVIMPDIGIALDFSASDFIFTYRYTDRNDHYQQLKNILTSVYKQYTQDKTGLALLGKKGYDYVHRHNNWDAIGAQLRTIYRSALSSSRAPLPQKKSQGIP